jgi:hypothetical protein
VSFDSALVICWSFGELGAGIVCACLATLRPLGTSESRTFAARDEEDDEKTRVGTLTSTTSCAPEKPAAYPTEGVRV